MEVILLYIIIFFISTVQSIAGVGVLVLGTPILLVLNYSIIETMFFLLPISIISSFGNLILINSIFKIKNKIDLKLIKYFFIFCFPSICIGLIVVKNFNELINFNILVSVIIIFSIIVKIKFNKFFINLNKNFKKIVTFVIGFIHGLSNSGGTLLSLFISSKEKENNNLIRFEIHLLYFFLAITQFIFLYFLLKDKFEIYLNLYLVLPLILISCFVGNILANKFKDISLYAIYILATISSIILFIKGI